MVDVGREVEVGMVTKKLSVVSVLFSVSAYFGIFYFIPKFQDVLEGFESELPTLTAFILATYKFYFLLSLLGVIPWLKLRTTPVITRDKERQYLWLLILNILLAFLVIVFVLYGLYLPIFQRGDMV